jgi:hypothetical protein
VQATQDSIATLRERTAMQMRAYISVVVGSAIFQEGDASPFKGAAKLPVPCQRIPYKAVDRFCGPVDPVVLLFGYQSRRKRGIRFLSLLAYVFS